MRDFLTEVEDAKDGLTPWPAMWTLAPRPRKADEDGDDETGGDG